MKKLFYASMILFLVSTGLYASEAWDFLLLDSSNIVSSANYPLNLYSGRIIDYLSFQAVYSSAAYDTTGFIDGTRSTGTITIVSTTTIAGSTVTINGFNYVEAQHWYKLGCTSDTAKSLYTVLSTTFSPCLGSAATGYVTVTSTFSLTNSSFTVYGKYFKEGLEWSLTNTTTGTAKNIYTILASSFSGVMTASWVDGSSTVNLYYNIYGTTPNVSMTSFVSSITVSGMSGGKNRIAVPVNTNLIQYSRLDTASVIYSTAYFCGPTYPITSSIGAITVTGVTGGFAADIDYNVNSILKTNNYPSGLAVLFSTATTGSYLGLTDQTTYFTIATSTSIQLATTKANALAGTAVDITSVTLPGNGYYTLTPVKILSTSPAAFRWEVSNDNLNWYALSQTSVTITASTTHTNYFWDLGFGCYKYIRAALTMGNYGAINLKLRGYGKRVAP